MSQPSKIYEEPPMFSVVLFTTAKTQKQPMCPWTDDWIREVWYILTAEYHSASRKKVSHLLQCR